MDSKAAHGRNVPLQPLAGGRCSAVSSAARTPAAAWSGARSIPGWAAPAPRRTRRPDLRTDSFLASLPWPIYLLANASAFLPALRVSDGRSRENCSRCVDRERPRKDDRATCRLAPPGFRSLSVGGRACVSPRRRQAMKVSSNAGSVTQASTATRATFDGSVRKAFGSQSTLHRTSANTVRSIRNGSRQSGSCLEARFE